MGHYDFAPKISVGSFVFGASIIERNYIKALLTIISIICLLITGCNTTEPVTEEIQEKSWQSIPEFAALDVRYIIKNNDKLYIAAVNTAISNSSTLGRL